MTRLKQYIKAMLKVYLPLILVFICGDAFAVDSGIDGLDAMANETKKAAKGGFMPIATVAAAVMGIGFAVVNQTVLSVITAIAIIVAAVLMFKFGVVAFALLV